MIQGPITYPVLIGHIDFLPALFERIIMPSAVLDELSNTETPPAVRNWLTKRPEWLDVQDAPACFFNDSAFNRLDDGEQAGIQLATALHADLLLMDDRAGVMVAQQKGLDRNGHTWHSTPRGFGVI